MSREIATLVRVVGGIVGVTGLLLVLSMDDPDTLARFALFAGTLAFVVGSMIVGNIDSKQKWAGRDRTRRDHES